MTPRSFRVEVGAQFIEVVCRRVFRLYHVLVAYDLPFLLQIVIPK